MALEITKIEHFNSLHNVELNNIEYTFFHGKALDLRGKSILELSNKISKAIEINYLFEESYIELNKDTIIHYELMNYLNKLENKNILIESTTLSIAEILLLLHHINLSKYDFLIKILYLEPEDYRVKSKKNLDFELSNNGEGFYEIRPYNKLIDSTTKNEDKAEVAVLLGFEDERLGNLISYHENMKFRSFVPILGLPAFKPEWENITLLKNIRHLKSGFKELEYTGATNPYQTLKVLEKIKANSDCKNILIAAFGTKPCAIGASIFLVNNFKPKDNNVGVIYDFPKKTKDRTTGIGKVYLYSLKKYS